MAWQKRARIGVAVFGIACAGVVYTALGQRRAPAPVTAVRRLDPKALLESTAGLLKQVRGVKEDFKITFDRQLTYENGRSKLFGVHVERKGGDRDFHVSADEAEAGDNQRVLQLSGNTKLTASDGFTLATDRAVFNRDEEVVRSEGKVTFGKARMSGYGSGTTYNQRADVLSIAKDAHVEIHDEQNRLVLDFNAGAATLDRMQDLLTLDGTVHVVRDQQTIEADHAVAHMDSEDQYITLLELRGNARVQGTGGSLDAMSARDMDLHYTADGKTLERVVLTGGAGIALTGDHGAPGRTITGDSVDLQLAEDGSLTHVTAMDPMVVRLTLPASEGTPARRIQARTLDGTGAPGKGLTNARFTDAVEFREDAQKGGNGARTVRARTLDTTLTDASVGDAVFTGSVRFEEQGLTAGAAELRYRPDAGVLQLNGADAGGGPRVEDDQITVNAQAITLTLQGRRMTATTAVKTTLRPHKEAAPSSAGSASSEDATRLPGLLKQDEPANVNAEQLQYDGAAGRAQYTGGATLWQGETSIRADGITIDQQSGDMVATGSAVARLALDTGESVGQASEIRYEDARRMITYAPAPAKARQEATPQTASAKDAEKGGSTRSPAAAQASQPHLSGPQGDLRADRIELFLAQGEGRLDHLEAYGNVTMAVDPGTSTRRTATGGRLTYRAATEQYDITGTASAPVKVVESCREITGKTLTFYKSADRITVDGNDEIRTQTKSSGPCQQSAAPRASRP